MRLQFIVLLTIAIVHQAVFAAESLLFECKRAEKDFIEEYEMKLMPATKASKAKIFLDGRDLDRSDKSGTQVVKSIQFVSPNIVILIDARFEPESIESISYPAGTVSTLITLNQTSGKLKKVETIQGGILGSNLGNGTRISEEACLPVRTN